MTDFPSLIAQPAERHYLYGDTRTGKSAFDDWEMRTISETRPDCMQVLVDSKPRFRAETERMPFNAKGRRSAAWRYKGWQKGPTVPNSVVVDLNSPHPFRGMWTRPGEIAILQSGDESDWRRMLTLLMAFTKAQIGERERHLTVDEILDFYGRNTMSIRSREDVFYRAARAGGERNIGMTLASQYVIGLPILIRKQWTRVTLFHLSTEREIKILNEMGIDADASPRGNYEFYQWTKKAGGGTSDRFEGTLDLPDKYLNQLAAV